MVENEKPQRELILDAAEVLFREFQNGDFTTEQLVDRSGVSRASVYRLFRSREVLLEALRSERGLAIASESAVRERLLRAAMRLFGTRGPSATTLEEVAQEAGVGIATLYRHFGDRSGLFLALAKGGPAMRNARTLPEPGPDYAQDFERFVASMLEILRSQGLGMLRAAIEREQHPELWEAVTKARGEERTHLQLERWLRGLQSQGYLREGNPKNFTLLVIGTLFAFGKLGELLEVQPEKTDEDTAKILTELLLHGLEARAPAPSRSKRQKKTKPRG